MKQQYFKIIILAGLISILLFICVIRLYGLNISPPGYYKDEAAMAVNGYCILKTGRDEFGIKWPVFFKSFDDWKSPIYIYSQLPWLAIFGEDILATKFTSAIWGLASILLFMYFIQVKFNNKFLSLTGGILLGLLPWHYHFSRVGFELITLPFFVILFLLALTKFQYTQKYRWFFIATIAVGLIFYTYAAGKFYSLLFFAFQNLIYFKKIKIYQLFLSLVVFITLMLPAYFWWQKYPEAFEDRLKVISINQEDKNFKEILPVYIKGYLSHFTKSFWFLTGDYNLRHTTGYHYPLLWSTAPLFIFGFFLVALGIKDHLHRLMVLIFLTFPAISAYTQGAPHVQRTIQVIPVTVYFMIITIRWLIGIKYRPRTLLVVATLSFIWSIGFFYEANQFLKYYFTIYPVKSALSFHEPDIKSIKALLNYPLPHTVSKKVSEYRWSTYQLIRQMQPAEIQAQTKDVIFEDLDMIALPYSGYYLGRGSECLYFQTTTGAKLIEIPNDDFCIYKIE